jgi:hypothetical protein
MQGAPRVEIVPRSVGFMPPVETISAACETHRARIVHLAMHGVPDPPSPVVGFAVQIGPAVATLEPDAIRRLRGLDGCCVFSGACRTGTHDIAAAFLAAGAVGYMAPRERLVVGDALGAFKSAVLVQLAELAAAGGLADGQRANAVISQVLATPGALRLSTRHGQLEMDAFRSYCTWTMASGRVVCYDHVGSSQQITVDCS